MVTGRLSKTRNKFCSCLAPEDPVANKSSAAYLLGHEPLALLIVEKDYQTRFCMTALRLMYVANILVAGWIGIAALFFPKTAANSVFSNAYTTTEVMRLVGCLWLAIAFLSVPGLARPVTFSPVLLLQLLYKSAWLFVVALPAIKNNQPYPAGMALFFLVWCIVLPFVIPWSVWIKA
jgi:hypothetical protein